jgi:phosphohistidine phosphatase
MMKTLLIRHAIAEERGDFAETGKPDSERPLTREGRSKMRRITSGLASLVPEVDLIATSPYTRCLQTAKIVGAAWPDAEIVRLPSLEPNGSHEATLEWLAERSHLRCVAVVGHQPSMGELLTLLLECGDKDFFEFKKGGSALVSSEGKSPARGAVLEWAIQPAALRLIAKGKRG